MTTRLIWAQLQELSYSWARFTYDEGAWLLEAPARVAVLWGLPGKQITPGQNVGQMDMPLLIPGYCDTTAGTPFPALILAQLR